MRKGLPPGSSAWARHLESRLGDLERPGRQVAVDRTVSEESLRAQQAVVRLHSFSFEVYHDSTELGIVDLTPPPGFREAHVVGARVSEELAQDLNFNTFIDVTLTADPLTEYVGTHPVVSILYLGGVLVGKSSRRVSFREGESALLRAMALAGYAPAGLLLEVDFQLAVAWLP